MLYARLSLSHEKLFKIKFEMSNNLSLDFINQEQFLEEIYGLAYDIKFMRNLKVGAISEKNYNLGKNYAKKSRPKELEYLICQTLRSQLFS